MPRHRGALCIDSALNKTSLGGGVDPASDVAHDAAIILNTLRSTDMDQAVQTLLDKQTIYELSCRYMRGLDRLDMNVIPVANAAVAMDPTPIVSAA